jgi:hypothetical protein
MRIPDRLVNLLHGMIALACTWLVFSSPWLGMYQQMPSAPGMVNLSHVALGLAMLPLAALYFAACAHGGRWRQYFPWLAGQFGALRQDVTGIFAGERPASEGGGLFATIEGLLLLALIAAALSGALWFVTQGSEVAVAWRAHHILLGRGFAALMLLHLVAVSLHLLDFVRD